MRRVQRRPAAHSSGRNAPAPGLPPAVAHRIPRVLRLRGARDLWSSSGEIVRDTDAAARYSQAYRAWLASESIPDIGDPLAPHRVRVARLRPVQAHTLAAIGCTPDDLPELRAEADALVRAAKVPLGGRHG